MAPICSHARMGTGGIYTLSGWKQQWHCLR
jgi:hypothetical protein